MTVRVMNSRKLRDELRPGAVGLVGGVIGGILTVVFAALVLLGQKEELYQEMTIDSAEKRQGEASLKLDFIIAPKRPFLWSVTRLVGGLLHADSTPDLVGDVGSVDWREYQALRFYSKSAKEGFRLSEFNIFVGQHRIQYIFSDERALTLSTGWRRIEIPIDRFYLAPWVREFRRDLVPEGHEDIRNAIGRVTGIGIDIKTDDLRITNSVWIDYLELVREDGRSVVFSDADARQFEYEGKSFIWFGGARGY